MCVYVCVCEGVCVDMSYAFSRYMHNIPVHVQLDAIPTLGTMYGF